MSLRARNNFAAKVRFIVLWVHGVVFMRTHNTEFFKNICRSASYVVDSRLEYYKDHRDDARWQCRIVYPQGNEGKHLVIEKHGSTERAAIYTFPDKRTWVCHEELDIHFTYPFFNRKVGKMLREIYQ